MPDPFPFKVVIHGGFYARVPPRGKTRAPKKAENVGAVKSQEGLTQPAVEPRSQYFLRAKGHVRCPFTLKNSPVVRQRHSTQMSRMQGVHLLLQLVQFRHPIGLQLLVKQLLS